jgi:hypothetical protein
LVACIPDFASWLIPLVRCLDPLFNVQYYECRKIGFGKEPELSFPTKGLFSAFVIDHFQQEAFSAFIIGDFFRK